MLCRLDCRLSCCLFVCHVRSLNCIIAKVLTYCIILFCIMLSSYLYSIISLLYIIQYVMQDVVGAHSSLFGCQTMQVITFTIC